MIRCMVVEDEVVERQALRMIITRELEQVEIVGEAENGRQAIEKANDLRPDLILMDIKMPGIDGVEAVKEIKRVQPNMKFIMISAFDTFEYAREVMKQGVKEYLLKPSRKLEIIETIQRVITEVESERRERHNYLQLKEKLNQALAFAQSEWVTSLFMDHIQEMGQQDWLELIKWDFNAGCVAVFQFSNEVINWSRDEKVKLYAWLKNKLTQKTVCIVGPMTHRQVPVIFPYQDDGETSSNVQMMQTIRDIINSFQKAYDNADVRIGIGVTRSSQQEFVHSYREALVALEKSSGSSHYFFYHPSLAAEKEKLFPFETEKNLLRAIKNQDVRLAVQLFDDYFDQLAASAQYDVHQLKDHVNEWLSVLHRMVNEMGIHMEKPRIIEEPVSPDYLRGRLKDIIQQTVEAISEWLANHAKGVMFQAKDFLDQHFTESVTLENAAGEAGLSPYYFSKLFKDHFGMTFIDYLTRLRVEKAKALMSEGSWSIKEICYQVGYKDPNYFSRVFKKSVGVSPSEYQNAGV